MPKPSVAPDDVAITEEYEAIYDAWNRLVELKYDDKTYYRYEYDGLNRRVRKIEYNSAGDTQVQATSSYYNSAWQLLEEYINADPEGSGTYELAYAYVWGKRYIDDLVMRVDYTSDSSGPVVNQTLFAMQDSKYNVAALYDAATDTVVERYEYTAYGECTVMDGSYNPRTSSSGDNQSLYDWSIRYSGYRFDIESGLYYVRNRSYHAQLGRWLQRDPVDYASGMNLYAGYFAMHGGLDPLGLDDYTEKWELEDGWETVASTGGPRNSDHMSQWWVQIKKGKPRTGKFTQQTETTRAMTIHCDWFDNERDLLRDFLIIDAEAAVGWSAEQMREYDWRVREARRSGSIYSSHPRSDAKGCKCCIVVTYTKYQFYKAKIYDARVFGFVDQLEESEMSEVLDYISGMNMAAGAGALMAGGAPLMLDVALLGLDLATTLAGLTTGPTVGRVYYKPRNTSIVEIDPKSLKTKGSLTRWKFLHRGACTDDDINQQWKQYSDSYFDSGEYFNNSIILTPDKNFNDIQIY